MWGEGLLGAWLCGELCRGDSRLRVLSTSSLLPPPGGGICGSPRPSRESSALEARALWSLPVHVQQAHSPERLEKGVGLRGQPRPRAKAGGPFLAACGCVTVSQLEFLTQSQSAECLA